MRFSFPSINEILKSSTNTVKRFPLAITAGVFGSICAIWFFDLSPQEQQNSPWLSDLIFVSGLSISLFTGLSFFSESKSWNNSKTWLLRFSGLALITIYYFLGQSITEGADQYAYRLLLLLLATHLFTSFSAFIGRGTIEEFWGFNKTLFLNILTSAMYSAVLFMGLSIALLSIDNLLGFHVKQDRYFQLWIILVGVFNTIFFLAKAPKPGAFGPSVTEYPKALKVFVQYVLIPLVSVYILILYSYLIKILFQWELPTGWVANLVLSFSIAGIFSLLLLHPIKDEVGNKWIRLYSKLYYAGLVPLVVLLFVSIGTRISEYGVTINRFFVATLAVWLAGIVIYFIFSKAKNIKVIPVSLCLVALSISLGPMSAFSVSERSQTGRISEILSSIDLLDESGKVLKSEKEVSFNDRKNLSSGVKYLVSNHGIQSLDEFFEMDLATHLEMENKTSAYSKSVEILSLMGMEYLNYWEGEKDHDYFDFYTSEQLVILIEGYNYFLGDVELFMNSDSTFKTKEYVQSTWKVSYRKEEKLLFIENTESSKNIEVSLLPVVEKLLSRNLNNSSVVPPEDMIFEQENDEMKVKILLTRISGSAQRKNINSMRFDLFIADK